MSRQRLWVFECSMCPVRPQRLEIDGRATSKTADDVARQKGWADDRLGKVHRCPKCYREGRTEVKR